MLFDENGQRNVSVSVESAFVTLVSTLYSCNGSAEVFHKITRFNNLKNNKQAALIDLYATADNQPLKNICRVVVYLNKYQHVKDVNILWGYLSKEFFETNYIHHGILFFPNHLMLNNSLCKERFKLFFIKQIGGVKKQFVKDFTLDQKRLVEYIRHQRDELAYYIGCLPKSYSFSVSLSYKDFIKSYVQNKVISDSFDYKSVSNFIKVALFNQIRSDLEKISKKGFIDEVFVNDFVKKLEPVVFNNRKPILKVGLGFSVKQINECVESVQQHLAECEDKDFKNNFCIIIIYLNPFVHKIIKDYLNDQWVVSVFKYRNFSHFIRIAIFNQVGSDLEKLVSVKHD